MKPGHTKIYFQNFWLDKQKLNKTELSYQKNKTLLVISICAHNRHNNIFNTAFGQAVLNAIFAITELGSLLPFLEDYLNFKHLVV